MQKKQALTTIQPAQRLGIKYEKDILILTQGAKPGHLVFNTLIDMSVNLRGASAITVTVTQEFILQCSFH